jgi:sec-independent protein translocase protein TatB
VAGGQRCYTRPMIGGLSMTEVIIILGLALLLLGPDQLPQMAKSIGKGLREIRKATDDLKGQFEQEIARIEEEPRRMIAPVPAPPAAGSAAAAADPAAARASARTAASLPPAPAAPPLPADPAEARAQARRAAAEQAKLKLVPPEGTVPREDV